MARAVHNKWFVKSDSFFLNLVAQKMSSSAKLKEIILRYLTAWRDFRLMNTMSTGKLKIMKFKVSHFWDGKRPTDKSGDIIPTMLGPARIRVKACRLFRDLSVC